MVPESKGDYLKFLNHFLISFLLHLQHPSYPEKHEQLLYQYPKLYTTATEYRSLKSQILEEEAFYFLTQAYPFVCLSEIFLSQY